MLVSEISHRDFVKESDIFFVGVFLFSCWLVGKKGTVIYTAALSKNLLRFFFDDMLMKICCFGGFVCSRKENYQ